MQSLKAKALFVACTWENCMGKFNGGFNGNMGIAGKYQEPKKIKIYSNCLNCYNKVL